MAETLGIVIILGIFVTVFVAVIYGVGILIISTPLVRWCLITVVMFLAFRVLLLPFTYMSIWLTGHPEVTLEEEIRAQTLISLATSVIPTRGSSKFTLLARGSLTNNSNRVIWRISISCRIVKLSFGDYETASKNITVTAGPGETKDFSETIAADLTGVTKAGFLALQAPDERFCRLNRIYEGERT
jgi:hypothetical protein